MMKLMMKLAHWSSFHRFFLSYGPQNVENGRFILGFMLSSAKLEVIWCNLKKLIKLISKTAAQNLIHGFLYTRKTFLRK